LIVRAFIQARMSSQRYPGKVLAPFRGRPLVVHVVDAVAGALDRDAIVVATTTEPADDPLAVYLERAGITVFRGAHEDVLRRFNDCAVQHPSEWILRISADSPLLAPSIVAASIEGIGDDIDVVSTVFPRRTFPRGQNAELVRTDVLASLADEELTDDDREHVTSFLYRHSERFRIAGVEASAQLAVPPIDVAVDTVEDLWRLESTSA
jgi:spore coat polysaccharide biosynthesis protein SpsF